MGFHQAFIGIGSNRGAKREHCLEALSRLEQVPGHRVVRRSSWYLTQPVGMADPEWFVNGVVLLETGLGPRDLLKTLLAIEKQMGRERKARWEPRVIDLDLLTYNQEIIREADLVVPHPCLDQRRFVLEPMAEIAPDYMHPVLNRSIAQLKDALPEGAQDLVKLD